MNNRQFSHEPIFTIGHSNHELEKFIMLLKENQIEMVADIRSVPYSRFACQFNKAAISESLKAHGMKYLYLGDKLGGRPDDKRFYDDKGHVLYSRLAERPEFHEGIDKAIKWSHEYRLALMCSEEDPLKCHRYHLVSMSLQEKGITVIHIRGDGRQQSKDDLNKENEAMTNKKKQLSLFN